MFLLFNNTSFKFKDLSRTSKFPFYDKLLIKKNTYLTCWYWWFAIIISISCFQLDSRQPVKEIYLLYVLRICESDYKFFFISTLLAIKGVLLLFGVFFAWKTRNVTFIALNDSKIFFNNLFQFFSYNWSFIKQICVSYKTKEKHCREHFKESQLDAFSL